MLKKVLPQRPQLNWNLDVRIWNRRICSQKVYDYFDILFPFLGFFFGGVGGGGR